MPNTLSVQRTRPSTSPRKPLSKVGNLQLSCSSCAVIPFPVNVYFPLIHPGGSTEAATIPLAAMTAAVGLYQRLSLPLPWHPTTTPLPLLIYGAATAVGSFAVQLAQQSNIHPLICIAGRGTKHVEGMIDKSKGDIVLDYRNVNLVQNIKDAVSETSTGKLEYAFDAVSEKGSFQNICKALDHTTGQITLVLPGRDYSDIPSTIRSSGTLVGCVHKATDPDKWQKTTGTSVGNEDFGFIFYRLFSRGLQQGWLKPHPFEVVPGGLGGVEGALRNLKEGNASAVKYVFRIADTEGLERNKLWKWSGV